MMDYKKKFKWNFLEKKKKEKDDIKKKWVDSWKHDECMKKINQKIEDWFKDAEQMPW